MSENTKIENTGIKYALRDTKSGEVYTYGPGDYHYPATKEIVQHLATEFDTLEAVQREVTEWTEVQ